MKIAVLTSRFPYPLEKGDKLRLFHQLRVLSQQHELVLIALSETPPSDDDLQRLQSLCQKVYVLPLTPLQIVGNLLASVARDLPFQVGYFYNNTVQTQIRTILRAEQPEHIYCQLIRMACYAEGAAQPFTLDFMDNFSINTLRRAKQASWFTSWFWHREARKTAAFEQKAFLAARRSTIISAQDRDLLPFEGKMNVKIIPNGVDTTFFTPCSNTTKKYDLAFVGNMGYKPNVEAAKFLAEQILPLVWQKRPQTTLLIAGARPATDVQNLHNQRITITGWLADIRDAYNESTLLVAPLFTGSGQQNKILEGMAMGVPCVTTTLVNNAIGAKPSHEIITADSAPEFATAILSLLEAPEHQAKISQNALHFVKNTFSWQYYTEQLSLLFK